MDQHSKAGVTLKALDDAGHGLARIAMLSAIDHDGDTYAPGAFGEQWTQIVAAHDWQTVPLGKARVYEAGDEALAELHMNLATAAGRDWHAALKFDLDGGDGIPPVQEWSYGFRILEAEDQVRDGDKVRVLKRLQVHEVSPVVKGAGIGTATLAMKGDNGTPFAGALDAAIAAAGDCLARARSIKDLRSREHRALSAVRLKQLGDLHAGLAALIAEIEAHGTSDLSDVLEMDRSTRRAVTGFLLRHGAR